MTKPKRPAPRGPIVLNGVQARDARPVGRAFGAAMPEGPLPGPLLVQLSRLHRAERAMPDAPGEPCEPGGP